MRMDRYLGHPLFREVAPLRSFPTANQTLLKQAGYRDLLRTFALGEVGSRLALDLDVDDIFAASQRNAAALYEYWTFLQLADAVGAVCGSRKAWRFSSRRKTASAWASPGSCEWPDMAHRASRS